MSNAITRWNAKLIADLVRHLAASEAARGKAEHQRDLFKVSYNKFRCLLLGWIGEDEDLSDEDVLRQARERERIRNKRQEEAEADLATERERSQMLLRNILNLFMAEHFAGDPMLATEVKEWLFKRAAIDSGPQEGEEMSDEIDAGDVSLEDFSAVLRERDELRQQNAELAAALKEK